MEEFIIAIVLTGMLYAVLRFFKLSWLKQSFPPTFIYLAGVFAWSAILASLATVYSFFSLLIDLITALDTDTLIPFVVLLIALGIAVKFLVDRKEILDINHMIPFLRAAVMFRPYDARRQELFERNERMMMAEAQRAAATRGESGEQAEGVLDISEEGLQDSTVTPQSGKTEASVSEVDILKRGEAVDVSELFKSKTAKLPAHPLYPGITVMRIDPSEKEMKFNLTFPSATTGPELTPEKLVRCKQGIYQVLQAIMVEQWLKPFSPFFTAVSASCLRTKKDEFDMVRETVFMTVRIGTDQLRQLRGRPFNSTEFGKMAAITMVE
jgi:hypothetical protein